MNKVLFFTNGLLWSEVAARRTPEVVFSESSFSYMALALKITDPEFTDRDGLLLSPFSIFFGFTLYIYSRPHLKAVTTMKKVAYSVLGSVMFIVGSGVMITLARIILVQEKSNSKLVGLVAGALTLKLGYDYLKNSDKLAATIGPGMPSTDILEKEHI